MTAASYPIDAGIGGDAPAKRQGKLCQHEKRARRRGDECLVEDPVSLAETAPDNFIRHRQQQEETPPAKSRLASASKSVMSSTKPVPLKVNELEELSKAVNDLVP